MIAMTIYGLKELLMHVTEPTGYQAFVGLLCNLNTFAFCGSFRAGELVVIPSQLDYSAPQVQDLTFGISNARYL